MKSLSIIFLTTTLLLACKQAEHTSNSNSKIENSIKSELDNCLEKEILNKWYPLVIDSTHGGFLSDFDYQWKKKGSQNKMIVTQARHLWTLSKAMERYPENDLYKSAADHGFKFLNDVMWDKTNGGFVNLVKQNGVVIPDANGNKMKLAYGNSFAIYGLAAYYKASKKPEALALAKRGFDWLEKHSHDDKYGGYFQFMDQEGDHVATNYGNTPPKDQNSSIHLMEAFTELAAVWENDLLNERLHEIMLLIRDDMTDDRGFLNLFFQHDWEPHSYRDSTEDVRNSNYNLDHVSFGHDIETAWLLLEASNALSLKNDQETLDVAKKMVDHGLAFGYDNSIGGVYDRGYYFKDSSQIEIIKDGKNWWTQVETMNTLLYLSKIYPEDQMDYYGKFKQQWSYIQDYLIDKEHGGFYPGGIDKEPDQKRRAKSQIWKGPYHTFRAIWNCSQMLEE